MTKAKSVLSCIDPGQVKVLIVRLNEFSKDLWEKCVVNIRKYHQIDLSELESRDSNDVILKKLGCPSKINYKFITSLEYDTSDFIDFQLHQRVFGIIGIFNGELDSLKAEEIMAETKDKFSYEVTLSILVVEDDKIEEKMKQFTVSVIENMSKLLSELSQRPNIPSPCGIEEYSGTASRSSTSKIKMKLDGRVQKLLADLHLLTGFYSEAVACYVSAVEDAKVANDCVWSAAAQEGFNMALCLQNEQLMINDDKTEIYKFLIDKLIPLATTYERSRIPILSIDLQIICSKIYRFIGQGPKALNLLADTWKSCNLLGFDDKCAAYNRVLKELAVSGNWRKWSLYMVQLAQTLKTAQKPEMALMTLSKTLKVYNLTSNPGGWTSLQCALLKEMVKLSESHSNKLLYFLYGWMYLARSNKLHDTSDQVQIIENLKKKSIRDMFSLSSHSAGNNEFVCTLPIFESLQLEKANDGLFILDDTVVEADDSIKKTEPFIYNPNSTKNGSNLENESLISGENAIFKLILSNPFMFPIVLKNIYLLADDPDSSPKISEQISAVTLPPMTKSKSVLINLLPEKVGKFQVLGFCATFMNVEIQILINSKGKVLSKIEENDEFGLQFCVIEPQALLSHSPRDDCLQLFEGEFSEIVVSFNNLKSTCSITKMNFKINENCPKLSNDSEFKLNEILFGNEKYSDTFSVDFEEFEKLVPIKTLNFNLKLNLFGSALNGNVIRNGTFELLYSSSGVYWRKLVVPLSVTVFPIVKLESFSFYPTIEDISSKNVLSKFKEANKEEECCVASFIARNLDSSTSVNFNLKIENFLEINEEIQNESAKRIIFLIPKLEKKKIEKLPLNEKQIVSIRKLRKNESEKEKEAETEKESEKDLVDNSIYDLDSFFIKKYLIEKVNVSWSTEDARKGKVSLIQSQIPTIYHDSIFKTHYVVQANENEFKNLKIGQEIKIEFIISPEGEEVEIDYNLKIFPVVVLGDREIGQNFDSVLKFTGCLDSFVRGASRNNPQRRNFTFYPISTATIKIIYQVIEMETGKVHWCEKPILMRTTRFE